MCNTLTGVGLSSLGVCGVETHVCSELVWFVCERAARCGVQGEA